MKKKILINSHLLSEGLSLLKNDNRFEIDMPKKGSYTEEEFAEKIKTADTIIATFSFPIRREMMLKAEKLKLILTYGVGFNHIDLETAKERGIIVCNTPQAVTEATSETAIALLLATARHVAECDRKVRDGSIRWGMLENLGQSLYGKTLAIIGMGRIGKSITTKAQGLGMNVVYYTRTRLTEEDEKKRNVKFLSMEEILSTADVITLAVPLTEHTHHLIGATELKKMKKTAIIINISRGPVIDENALADALEEKTIYGAGLDVYENEPLIHPKLLTLDNVVLLPHKGTATIEARNAISQQCSQNIINFYDKKYDLLNRVV